MKNYTCAICGKEYSDLDAYLSCVYKCGETLRANKRAEEEKKRLEEINAALNRVKEAKKYFEEQLADFEKKYPVEYKMNFGAKDTEECKCNCTNTEKDNRPTVYTLSYNGKDKPVFKVNGQEKSNEFVNDLLSDPDMKYIGELLGLFD